jgi:hypothetical protein
LELGVIFSFGPSVSSPPLNCRVLATLALGRGAVHATCIVTLWPAARREEIRNEGELNWLVCLLKWVSEERGKEGELIK